MQAHFGIDVRAGTAAQHSRLEEAISALKSTSSGTSFTVHSGSNRARLEEGRPAALFEGAGYIAKCLGRHELGGVAVGGGSDGNFTAALGVPTLDGLGPVGDGAHAEGEHIVVSEMVPRPNLVEGLLRSLLGSSVT